MLPNFFALVSALLLTPTAHAFRLDPMVVALPLKTPQASGTYVVENNTKEKVAVQFDVRRRVLSLDGKEERPPATGFIVYPEQMALEPGEKRSVRISWVSETMPETEQAYRFVASQLPVDFNAEKQASRAVKINFLMEYVASLYLVPPGVKPKMRVVKQVVGKNGLELTIANEGTAHFLLDRADVKLSANGKTLPVSKETLDEIRTENVLAGNQRRLVLPLPKGVTGTGVKAAFTFEP